MKLYNELEYSESCSEVKKEIKDSQLAPGLNTIFNCSIQSLRIFQEKKVEIVLQFRLQAYPDQLIEKFTFHSQQILLIEDIGGAFYDDEWHDGTIELIATVYVVGLKKFIENFKTKIGQLGKNFHKNIPIIIDQNTRRIAKEILLNYNHRLNSQ